MMLDRLVPNWSQAFSSAETLAGRKIAKVHRNGARVILAMSLGLSGLVVTLPIVVWSGERL